MSSRCVCAHYDLLPPNTLAFCIFVNWVAIQQRVDGALFRSSIASSVPSLNNRSRRAAALNHLIPAQNSRRLAGASHCCRQKVARACSWLNRGRPASHRLICDSIRYAVTGLVGKRARASLIDLSNLKAAAGKLRMLVELKHYFIVMHGCHIETVMPDFIRDFTCGKRIVVIACRPGQRQCNDGPLWLHEVACTRF